MMNLHNHTTYSDGRLTPKEVVEAAIDSGLEYVGITDHFATRKVVCVKVDELGQYTASIRELAGRYKDRIRVLVGVELDASQDRTDFDSLPYDRVSELDFVLMEYVQDPLWRGMDLWEAIKVCNKIHCPVGLAHNDIGRNFAHTNMESLINMLSSHEIFIELCSSLRNSKFNKPYYRYAEAFFEAARGRILVSIGTDSHYDREEVGDISDALEFIREKGLGDSLVTDRFWK